VSLERPPKSEGTTSVKKRTRRCVIVVIKTSALTTPIEGEAQNRGGGENNERSRRKTALGEGR